MTKTASKQNRRAVKKKSQWKTIWIRFKRNKLALAGLIVFGIMALIVLTADLWLDFKNNGLKMNILNSYTVPKICSLDGPI